MLQLRKLVLRGFGVKDAVENFVQGGNILAGESDTGKSYLLHCLDYILGADELKKRFKEAEPYSDVFAEFENSGGEYLTLRRSLAGGMIAAYRCRIDDVQGEGQKVAPKRSRRSASPDITSVVFPFAGISEAQLRKNDRGQIQRLSIRMFAPVFLIDEIAVIDECSPITGWGGYDETARKRMFAFMLSGKDDAGIIADEKRDIAKARVSAQLHVISDLLEPLEQRIAARPSERTHVSIDEVEAAIAGLTGDLLFVTEERAKLFREREESITILQHAESQLLAIDELLARYRLLDGRYVSDLERLDFLAEGSHFFDSLQEVRCPLCEQAMSEGHAHSAQSSAGAVYESARAEAAKILGHRSDLAATIEAVAVRRREMALQGSNALAMNAQIDERIAKVIAPAFEDVTSQMEGLMARRVRLEAEKGELEQVASLRALKQDIEEASKGKATKGKWEQLPSSALANLCSEIEGVLNDWSWKGPGRVEFDQKEYDIIVDGQSRQSHGKGVRAVLYSAFVIGLLHYCRRYSRPHPGMVVIDSPLTSYKKGKANSTADGPIDAGIEASFWKSLTELGDSIQVIIVENKAPPSEVAEKVNYQWFAGENADIGERVGFIP